MNNLLESLKNIRWITDNSRTKVITIPQVNRPISTSQVTKLANSIRLIGVIRPLIIANLPFMMHSKLEYAIIDGQHLFHALLRLGLDMPCVEIEIKNETDLVEKIALLNSSSRSWTFGDYIHSWGYTHSQYRELHQIKTTYDFDYKTVAAYLSNKSSVSGAVTRMIKDGSFTIREKDKNLKLLDDLTECLTIIPRDNYWKTRYVCSEYLTFRRSASNYNHKNFLQYLKGTDKLYTFVHHEEYKLSEFFQEFKN